MKSGKYFLVLLLSILLTTAIACGGGEAEPTPTPEIPTPTPTAVLVLPNLIITNVAFNPAVGCEGSLVQVAVTIQNQGTQLSPSCYWSWQMYNGSTKLINTLPALFPGGTTVVHTEMPLAKDITGTCNTTAIVDSASEIIELNESDNEFIQPLTVSMCDFQASYQASYNSDKNNIQTALTAYTASHNGSLPLTNNAAQLYFPSGTYQIINICALIGPGDLLDEVPASCIDFSSDNCVANTCTCKQNAHYVWLMDGVGNVLSNCIGSDCDTNLTDGYQGIWP
jgi:hypothetical protein